MPDGLTSLPATRSKLGRELRSSLTGAPPDGCACRGIVEPASNPCSAYSAPARGWASPSAGARCSAPPSDACHSRGSEPQDRDIPRSEHHRGQGTAGPAPCSRAFAGSRLRKRVGPLPFELQSRAPPMRGSMRHKCFLVIWSPSDQNASAWPLSASRYGLGSTRSVPLPVAGAEKPPGCPAAVSLRELLQMPLQIYLQPGQHRRYLLLTKPRCLRRLRQIAGGARRDDKLPDLGMQILQSVVE